MECRRGCGACCIAPSISSPMPGMPGGKPAGVRCLHLAEDFACKLFGDSRRPVVCGNFHPEPDVCGVDRQHALSLIARLESDT
jgi:Fe-S-cluster containining protein